MTEPRADMPEGKTDLPSFRIGGVRVHGLSRDMALNEILRWARDGEHHFVCVRDAHGIVRAQRDPDLMAAHEAAGLVVTDGMPLVWRAKALGLEGVERITGRELMLAVCDAGRAAGLRHFFYGGAPGVADALAQTLGERFPGLEVAGTFCPPFRALTTAEVEEAQTAIDEGGADVVWVGLSTPKQELWMAQNVKNLRAAALLGVGAAFDYETGRAQPAPQWMQRAGLEWVFRIIQEPQRLIWRYAVVVPQFLGIVLNDALHKNHKTG